MNTSTAQQKLKERRSWWEAAADHTAEQATMDSESSFTFHLAMQKIAAISRTEKRIALGTFGRCERCGSTLDDDRLEAVLDSEYHYCADCASKPTAARMLQKSTRTLNGRRFCPWPTPQMA